MKFLSKERLIIFLKLFVCGVVGWSIYELLQEDAFEWKKVLFIALFFSAFMTLTYEGWAWGKEKNPIFPRKK